MITSLQAYQANPLTITDPRGIGRMLVAKLGNMGLKQSTANGEWLPQVKDIYAVGDRFNIYELDMLRLPRGVSKAALSDPKTLIELSAALRRHVFVDEDIDLRDDNGALLVNIGFSLIVDLRRREAHIADLPSSVPFDLRYVPDIRYPIPLGVTLNHNGEIAPLVYSLPELGHIVFVAQTGAGKSGLLRSLLSALQFAETPDTLKLALVDPKVVEFHPWNGSPFLVDHVANDLREATRLAKRINAIVDERTELFARTRTFNIDGFNQQFPDRRMPRILFAVDEMREMAAAGSRRSELDMLLSRGASKWRFAGVHLLITMTDPRSDVIDANILSNSRCKIVGRLARSLSISILGNAAAESMPSDRPGFLMGADLPGRRGKTYFQSYLLDDAAFPKVADFICGREGESLPAIDDGEGLSPAERHVFDRVTSELRGEFSVDAVFQKVKGTRVGDLRLTHSFVVGVGQRWEGRGWLAKKDGSNNRARIITTKMLADLGLELPAFMAEAT